MQEAFKLYEPGRITGGPTWVDHDKFDVEIKLTDLDTKDRLIGEDDHRRLLRDALEQRFHLKSYEEVRPSAVCLLTTTPQTLQLIEGFTSKNAPVACIATSETRPGHLVTVNCTTKDLSSFLTPYVDHAIIAKNEDDKRYNFSLHWNTTNDPSSDEDDLRTSLRKQLGMKLSETHIPLKHVVVDSATLPDAN